MLCMRVYVCVCMYVCMHTVVGGNCDDFPAMRVQVDDCMMWMYTCMHLYIHTFMQITYVPFPTCTNSLSMLYTHTHTHTHTSVYVLDRKVAFGFQ
jgi:hypothetical protein